MLGNGFVIAQLRNSDDKIGVINVQGRTFMQSIDCPFKSADWAINKILQQDVKVIFVDMHAEATAEKYLLVGILKEELQQLLAHTLMFKLMMVEFYLEEQLL